MLVTDDARIQDTRRGIERIHSRIDAELCNLTRQHRRCIKMRERCGRRRVGQVIGRHVNGLHRRDRALVGRRDAFLQVTHIGRQGRLIAHRRRDTAEQRRHFGAGLREAENVIDEEQHVLAFFVAEIFGQRQTGQADTRTRSGRLVHLAIDQCRLGFAIGLDNAGFHHLVIEIVTFTRTLADTGEHGVTAMCLRNVVDQFHDQHRLAHAGTAEQADFTTLGE